MCVIGAGSHLLMSSKFYHVIRPETKETFSTLLPFQPSQLPLGRKPQ